MRTLPYKPEALELMQRGAEALAIVENHGIRIDEDYLDKTIRRTTRRIKFLWEALQDNEVAKEWRLTFGRKTNFTSNDQLGKVLFDKMKFECLSFTEAGKYQVDEKALSTIEHPFVQKYLEVKKLEKVLGTYLKGIKREVVDGYLHPFFNLHIAATFRSSSEAPNFQNIPIRNEVTGKLIRTAFVARPGRHLVEIDYSGIEVCIAACYHKDPTMITYIKDKTKDMHRDMAQECFCLPWDEMNDPIDKDDKARIKKIRYCGKNMFVFPQFYGDWYIDCAKHLWQAMISMELKMRDGTSIQKYLARKGISELGECNPKEKPRHGTFEKHIQEVEKAFWNDRFPVYAQWKKDWYNKYQEKGYLRTKTGFICQGFMKRNEIINYPVQGSAFHCLLWSLTKLVLEELPRRKMKTLIVGQIHDSIVADVPAEELNDFLQLANQVMTVDLLQEWKWINIPLEIEADVTPINGCWFDKKEMKIIQP